MSYSDSFKLALPDIKRGVDAVITDGVLHENIIRDKVATIASGVRDQLVEAGNNRANHISYHYLKGGNSIKVLNAPPLKPGGDWDFQLIPDDETYSIWKTSLDNPNLKIVSDKIIEILQSAANQLLPDETGGLITPLDHNNIQAFLNNTVPDKIKSVIAAETVELEKKGKIKKEDIIPEGAITNVSYAKNLSSAYHVCLDCQRFAEWGIRAIDERYETVNPQDTYFDKTEQRLQFAGGPPITNITFSDPFLPFEERGYHDHVKPTIYVNNTIAGFLLFRLALVYRFDITVKEGNGNTFTESVNFKSEVVDISIPRMGNPEGMVSTKQKMSDVFLFPTNAEPKYKVPGWRYHLIENLNLIGEIDLGISGSPHKRDKRIARAGEAFVALEGLTRQATNINNPMTMKEFSERDEIAENPATGALVKSPSIVGLIYESLMPKSDSPGSAVSAARPGGVIGTEIRNNIISKLQIANPTITGTTNKSNVEELMKTLPYLGKGIIAPLTFDQINEALRLLLTPDSEIPSEADRFRVGLDGLVSVALGLSDVGEMKHPLGIVRIDINWAGFAELKKKLSENNLPEGNLTTVMKIEEKVSDVEILVTLSADKNGKAESTTRLHFKYDPDLDPVNVEGDYAKNYEPVDNEFWNNLAGYCKAYKVKDTYFEDTHTTSFDLLFLDYLSQVLMIHLRQPIMDLYSKYKSV